MLFKGTHALTARRVESETARRCVLFSVADVAYAVDAHRVRHLLPMVEDAGAPVVFDRAQYPIIDLHAFFRGPAAARPDRVMLIADDDRRGALLVDGVLSLARLEERAIQPLPPVFAGREREWIEGVAKLDGRIVVVVSVTGLLRAAGAGGTSAGPARNPAGVGS